MYKTILAAIRIITVITTNQLNEKPAISNPNASFCFPYLNAEDTFEASAAELIALTITVAPAVASMFIAVPTSVWSALKLIAATAKSNE